MTEPTATLDPRFSDPASSPTPWTETQQSLADAEIFWITTVRADGRPHVTPLVAVWVDDAIYFTTGAAEQKAVNLQVNPHVVLTTGCNAWDSGLDVVVEGSAEPVTDDARLARLAEAWSTKWDGQWRYEARNGRFHHEGGGEALVYAVRPRQILAFGKGTFTQTTHHF
jgi:nitroimidazol reductase NimA-like FMN-containing flavoprotein (pyridoxamine 5'-phosphate oxidase superfamily)